MLGNDAAGSPRLRFRPMASSRREQIAADMPIAQIRFEVMAAALLKVDPEGITGKKSAKGKEREG